MKLYLKEYVYHLQEVIESHWIKLMSVLVVLFAPIQGIMITIGLAILADTVVGIWKSRKLDQQISSRRLSRVISKMLIYQITIILFFMIDKFILHDLTANIFTIEWLLTKVIALTLVSIEVFSIDENIRQVRGSGLMEAFKRLIRKSKEIKSDIDDFDINKF